MMPLTSFTTLFIAPSAARSPSQNSFKTLYPKIALKLFSILGAQRAQNKRALPPQPTPNMSSSSTTSSKAAPPSPTTTGAHSALQAKHQARVQKLEAQIQNLEARLLKKRKRIERITDYVQPYDDDGKVPCTPRGSAPRSLPGAPAAAVLQARERADVL